MFDDKLLSSAQYVGAIPHSNFGPQQAFGVDNLKGPIAKSLITVQELYEKGHTDLCDIELIKLHNLTTNLSHD